MQNYYDDYLRLLEEQARQQAESRKGSLQNSINKINDYKTKFDNTKNLFNGFSQKSNPAINNAISDVLGGATTTGMSAIGNEIASNVGKDIGTSIAGAGSLGTSAATSGAGMSAANMNPWIAIASLAIDGANRKRARQSSDKLVKNTNKMAEEINNTQEYYEPETVSPQQIPTSNAPVYLKDNQTIKNYQDELRNQGMSEDVVNGVPYGLNSGNKNISDFINNYNNSEEGKTYPIAVPQSETDINIARTQSQLPTTLQGNITGNVETDNNSTLINKLANGLGDLQQGFKENLTTPFAPQNMYSNDAKGGMTRLGEAMGTVTRTLQKPAVQGLVAGGLSTALTGNPLYGLGMGYKYANKRSMNDIYTKALKNLGIDVDTGTFGNVGATDYKTLTEPEMKKLYYDTIAKYRQALIQDRMNRTQNDKNYKEGRIKIEQQNANTRTTNSLKSKVAKPKRLTKKQQRLNALANYKKIKATGNTKNIDAAKKNYILKYERNPENDLL